MSYPGEFVIDRGTLYRYDGKDPHVVIPEEAKSLGYHVFYCNATIESVVLPSTWQEVPYQAFYGCKNLKKVVLPQRLRNISGAAFAGCENLTDINLPEQIGVLSGGAFRGCRGLADEQGFLVRYQRLLGYFGTASEVVIPDGVVEIDDWAFAGNTTLKRVVIPDGVNRLGENAFSGCTHLCEVVLPDSITQISSKAFADNTALERMELPQSVTYVGEEAFAGCTHLREVVLKGSTQVCEKAFSYCTRLKRVEICHFTTTLGEAAFEKCDNLDTLLLPDTSLKIHHTTFRGCRGLADANGCVVVDGVMHDCFAAGEHVVISEGVRRLYSDSVGRLKSTMVKVTLPSTLEMTQSTDLSYCSALRTVYVPDNVKILRKMFPDWVVFELLTPETFYKTAEERSVEVIDDKTVIPPEDMAYVWLFQLDKKWRDVAKTHVTNPAETLSYMAKIYAADSSLPDPTPKVIADFISFFSDEITADAVRAFLQEMKAVRPDVAKALERNKRIKEALAVDSAPTHPIEVKVSEWYATAGEYRNEAVSAVKDGLPYADGSGICSKKALVIFLEQYIAVFMRRSYVTHGMMSERRELRNVDNFVQPAEAKEIAAVLDREALSGFLYKLVTGSRYRYYLIPAAFYATDTYAEKILRELSARRRGNAKDRYWADNMVRALYLCNCQCVADFMEKDKNCNFARYLGMRGMTVQSYRDRVSIPQWDVDEKGVIRSAYGRLGYAIQEDFSLRIIELETGKELRSVSSKTNPDAAAECKDYKKQVADFFKKRLEYLRGIYITAEEIARDHWLSTYCNNRLLRFVAEKAIWTDTDNVTFMLTDGVIHTVDGAAYSPVGVVRMAHVLEMSAEESAAWQTYLRQSGKKLLIEQVWEPVATVKHAEWYIEAVLSREDRNEFKRVLGRKAISVKSETEEGAYNHRAGRYEYSNEGVLVVGSGLWIEYVVNPDTGETTLKSFRYGKKKMSREINTILFELGRACVKSFIRRGDAAALPDLLKSGFTAAQVAEFIRLAQECGQTQVTAILLNYQQTHFADLDPMAEFTLD